MMPALQCASMFSPESILKLKDTSVVGLESQAVSSMGETKPSPGCCRRLVHVALVSCCLLSAIVGIGYIAFDPIVRTIILKKLVMTNSSENFHLWEDPPINPYFKVYFFNLTNPEDVFNGVSKPILQEVGPYTYHQKWLKQNITWHPNGTVSYKTRKVFTFAEDLSCEGCNETGDKITSLNVPVLTAYQQMRDANWFTRAVLTEYLQRNEMKQWIIKSPSELIWGYDEPLLPWARYFAQIPPHDKFGYFLTRNSSLDQDLPLYTYYTGMANPYNLSKIALYNGKTHLDYWKTDECNEVRGSDGASFNPFLKEEDTLWWFNDQLCRSIPLAFDKEITQQGLKAMRFKPRKDAFGSSKSYPSNGCFEEPGRITGDGVFDLSVCQFNARIILSWPHFLDAEEKFREAVEGLEPNETKHGFWFNIQPVTGTTMSVKSRFQINFAVEKLEAFDDLDKVDDIVLPILWFEDGVDELGSDIITLLKYAAISPQTYKQYILYFLVGLGSTEMVLFILALTKIKRNTVKINLVRHLPLLHIDHTIHTLKVLNGGDQFQPILPRLPSLSSPETSTDYSFNNSESSSREHSLNNSESSNIPYFINMTNAAFTPDNDIALKPVDLTPLCLVYPNTFISAPSPPRRYS